MPADQPSPAGEHERLRSLGKYQIAKRLGAGGMGAVFLATDTDLRRVVALKVLPKDRAENPTLVRRFKSEAQAVAQLRHDRIVAIYETGEINGYPYLALEYVDGHDLQSIIEKRGPLPPKRSLKILRQVADALQHAYERGIVHRDIKPSNLLVQVDGTCKITDFGLARCVDEELDTNITRAGTTVGTVDYISPEQAVDSKAADIRSDLYSLGCTWYHMLTGEPPFPDGNLQNKLRGHIQSPPPNPRALNPNVPEAYVAVMHRLMAKRPEDRYQTPAALIADLDQVAGAASHISAELFDETPAKGTKHKRRPVTADDETPVSHRAPPPPEASPAQPPTSAKSKRSPHRDAAAADDSAPVSKINPQWKGRGGPVRPPLEQLTDAEGDATAAASDHDAGGDATSRRLPPRKQSQPGGFAIDVDFARIGLIGLIVAGAVGLFWFAFSRGTSWNVGGRGGDAAGVEPAPLQPAPPVINPGGESGLNPNAPQAPITTAVVAVPVAPPTVEAVVPVVDLAGDAPAVKRTAISFPGVDDLTDPAAPELRELLPDWVYALHAVPLDGVSPLIVEVPPRPGAAATIDAAIQSSAAPERLVELHGVGPFTLRPVTVSNCRRLVVRAAAGARPVVQLLGNPDDARGQGYIHLTGGVLELSGLHVLASHTATQQPRTLFSVDGGTLVLRDCSVTAPEESGPIVVARVTESKSATYASRGLLERCLIRGPRVTALSGRGPRVDLVVGGSLIAADAGPLVAAELFPASGSPPPAAPASDEPVATPADTPLALRLLGSTLWTNGAALALVQRPSGSIQRGAILARRSLLASGGADAAVLLSLTDWPVRATSLSGEPRIAGLTWRPDRCLFAGWPHLVQIKDARATATDWPSFWGQPLESEATSTQPIALSTPLPQLTSQAAQAWSAAVPVEVSRGHTVGIAAPLAAPPEAVLDRLLLLAGRPRLPDGFETLPPAAETLRFDLRTLKVNLNELLNGPEVPDGAHVQLTGQGLVELPPLHFRNRTLRLEFLQGGEGAPFTLRPKTDEQDIPEAAILVEGGRLDLIGARIHGSPSKSLKSARPLLIVRDANFSLRNCHFEGGGSQYLVGGIVNWLQTRPGPERAYGYIRDTLLTGGQPLIVAHADARLLVLENNLLAGRHDGVALSTSAGKSVPRAQEGWVVLDHNTFLFGASALRLTGSGAGRKSPAVRVLAQANVFTPVPGMPAEETALLQHPEGMTPADLFDWRESRNGYAPAIKVFRRAQSAATPAAAQNFASDWVGFWGIDHVESPYTGVSGVMLATVLTSLSNLSPPMVALSPACTGAAGDAAGGSIGIRTTTVGPLGRTINPTPAAAPAPGTPRPPQPGNRPNF